jgi:hypothetical protein
MVRQIALDFLHRETKSKTAPDREDVALAIAFLLAESNRKGRAKLKFLSPATIPFWIVQTSDTNSIVLSSIGESSVKMDMSEDTATGPVKRILSSEIRRFEDIPDAVEKAAPLLKTIEPKVHQLRNIQEPGLFVALGPHYREVDPNEDVQALESKIDSSTALTISEEFRCLLDDARTRHGTMQELQKITKEKLTDQLKVMENVNAAEMARWEKRVKQQEDSSNERIEKLKERLSERIYRLRDTHEKNMRAIVAEFVRDTVEVERFFVKIVEDIKLTRQQLPDLSLQEAVDKYRSLVADLGTVVPTYEDATDSIEDLGAASLLRQDDLEQKLNQDIRNEEDSVADQIQELHDKLDELRTEMKEKENEANQLKKRVVEAIEIMDGLVEKRTGNLQRELEQVQRMSLSNDSIRDLAPLTLLHVNVWVATYTTGNPVVFGPCLTPGNRFGLPLTPTPLNQPFDTHVQKLIKAMLKDNASFKKSLNDICASSNILQVPASVSTFKKGIGELWTRQLLKEGIREKLEPLYSTMVGRCPECGAEIPPDAKFCNECGKSLL